MVKNLPVMQETQVRSLSREDPLKEWQPTPVCLLGEFHRPRSLAVSSPWGRKESDITERVTHTHTPPLHHPLPTTLLPRPLILDTRDTAQAAHLEEQGSFPRYPSNSAHYWSGNTAQWIFGSVNSLLT